MSKSAKKAADQAEREKVHKRYSNRREPDVIYPAKKQVDFYDADIHQRVAVYVRVSTDNLGQETSYELQKNYYEEFVLKHPNWKLVKIYADKGISGTSTKHSLSIGPTKAYGVICAVATLERIYTKYGYHVLDRTLRLCVGTWEGDIDSLGANVLAGVARMVVAFGDQLRDETFKERVGFMSVRQLSRIAKERGAGSLCYAEAMLVAYNRKCKYTLRMTKLHSGKVAAEDDFVEENEEPLADDPVLEE